MVWMIALIGVSIISICYTLAMFVAGSRSVVNVRGRPPGMRFVVMIPCLDEELVIGRSIERLLQIDDDSLDILVIDDGSTDHTASIVGGWGSDRVHLFRRTAPDCRQGKGEALNAAYRYVCDEAAMAGLDPQDVVVVVLDADGRLDPEAIEKVAPFFSSPDVGAVQIKVRIHNAPDAVLARLQDYEFATFTEVFQRARAQLGSSGLGGNGQFTRLSALMDLGDAPWTDCLTEDLELGINLLLAGHRNEFCPSAWVSQQGVTDIRRLVRQRARWFQGHLQCIRLIRPVVVSRLSPFAKTDLSFHLANSIAMLVFQTISIGFFLFLLKWWVTDPATAYSMFTTGLTPLFVYLFAFGLVPLITVSYMRTEPEISTARAIAYSHLYVLYTYMWWFAGWRAVYGQLRGKRTWAKTTRTSGTGDEPALVPGGQPPLFPDLWEPVGAPVVSRLDAVGRIEEMERIAG